RREQRECIVPVAVRLWQQCQTLGRRRRAKRVAAKRARKFKRTLKEETFRARPGLIICRAWPRWRCGHDKYTNDQHTSLESPGAGGTAAVGGVWRNGDGPVALPQANGGSAAAVCPGLGRSGKAAVVAGAGVLPDAGHVVHDEELRRRCDLCGRHGESDR